MKVKRYHETYHELAFSFMNGPLNGPWTVSSYAGLREFAGLSEREKDENYRNFLLHLLD